MLRSKKVRAQIEGIHRWTLDRPVALTPLFDRQASAAPATVSISSSLWDDIEVEKWLGTFLPSGPAIDFGASIIQAPLRSIDTLVARQRVVAFFVDKVEHVLTDNADAFEWFRNVALIEKNYLYQAIFPSAWYMRWLYAKDEVCTLYHWYRCYFSPMTNIVYPVTLVTGPLWFLRNKIGLKISVTDYLKMMRKTVVFMRKSMASSYDWYKFVLFVVAYVAIYLYSTLQSIDLSYQLHTFRRNLLKKIKVIIDAQKRCRARFVAYGRLPFWMPFAPDITPDEIFAPFSSNAVSAHALLTNPKAKDRMVKLAKVCVIHDTLIALSKRLNEGYCLPTFGADTFIGNMRNPMIGGVANPIRLQKHLVISGANAGGKTTYVKSLVWNIVLAQSFGILCGEYGQIGIYDVILHHHRVKDVTGTQSLFQAEMFKIREALDIIKSGSRVIYFMDEPMHSTHPIDGSIMLKALMLHLASYPKLTVVLTSHYFLLQDLAKEQPDVFKNLSVRAKMPEVDFDFKIYKGGSRQTVGIELLEKEGFETICATAIKIKKILYPDEVNV